MSKIISKSIKLNENVRGILTINEEKKRFHLFGISGKVGEEEILITTFNEIKKDQYNDYEFVPFERVFDHMDMLEVYDSDGNLMRIARVDTSGGYARLY
jgi:hypothetical protein